MQTQTLVLNAIYLPIDVQDWKKAIKKVVQEKAEILEEYTDSKLNDWSAMRAPAVIRLLYFINPPHTVNRYQPFTRKNVWVRDKGACQYCGAKISKKEMTWDHVVPKHQGGKTSWSNIVCACIECNKKKANRTPEQAGMKLLKYPFAPKISGNREKDLYYYVKSFGKVAPKEWANYVYWNLEMKA